jgi:hypothetical protein
VLSKGFLHGLQSINDATEAVNDSFIHQVLSLECSVKLG